MPYILFCIIFITKLLTHCVVNQLVKKLSCTKLFFTESSFSIYPNPTDGKIIFETTGEGYFSILSFSGKQLLQQEITEPTTKIDVSTLPSSVYFIRYQNENTVQIGKILKQ